MLYEGPVIIAIEGLTARFCRSSEGQFGLDSTEIVRLSIVPW